MPLNALLLIDIQNDFCPGGSYPVPDGGAVVTPLNTMIHFAREKGWEIFASRDWHPKSTQDMEGWTTHCVEHTQGAMFHPALKIDDSVIIISKGNTDLSNAHYSAFNGDSISLEQKLKNTEVTTLYIGGLATDYCVKNTALDGIKYGFSVHLLEDACRGIFRRKTKEEIFMELRAAGVHIATTRDVLRGK